MFQVSVLCWLPGQRAFLVEALFGWNVAGLKVCLLWNILQELWNVITYESRNYSLIKPTAVSDEIMQVRTISGLGLIAVNKWCVEYILKPAFNR
jgi:hypothetical protein